MTSQTQNALKKRPNLMTKLLPTSTAGSLPKPSWLCEPEKLWSDWKLEGDALAEAKQDALRITVAEQQF